MATVCGLLNHCSRGRDQLVTVQVEHQLHFHRDGRGEMAEQRGGNGYLGTTIWSRPPRAG
jgi:hypothetical protein